MGQYELVRLVGQGAFGRALLVKNRREDEKLYVIKEINLRQTGIISVSLWNTAPLEIRMQRGKPFTEQQGLRPSTADAEGHQSNTQEHHGNIRAAQHRRLQRPEEYLKQLQGIREQYHHDVRQMRRRAELEERLMTGTHFLKKNRERHTPGKQQKGPEVRQEVEEEVEEEVVKRAEWHRDAAETLLNALENMDVMTESSISLTQTEVF